MNLLMITRKVNQRDASPAGFTYNWLKKIGHKIEKLYVITWQESDRGDLSENIKIISLPKNKLKKVFILQKRLLEVLPKVDGLFCHQNPEYTILSAPLAKIFRKKIVSWYTHKEVNWKLKWVNRLADKILTASEKSCRLKDRKKIEVTGHGIDVEKFKVQSSKFKIQNSKFKIISIGRISPTKNYETLIEAVKDIENIEVEIIGGPVLAEDKSYFNRLKQIVKDRNFEEQIKFLGPIAHQVILPYYQRSDLFINLSQTGSVDKAVLEAMACQRLVLTSNEAFIDILKDERLLFESKNHHDLAQKIIDLMNLPEEEKEKIGQRLRQEVVKNHNLDNLVDKIILSYE